MPSQIYLEIKFEGQSKPVVGGSRTQQYEDQIEITSFSWGASSGAVAKQKEEEASKRPNYDVLELTKFYDVSSPALANCMAGRKRMEWAKLAVEHHTIQHGGQRNWDPVILLEIYDGFVDRLDIDVSMGQKSASVVEKLSLSYRKVFMTYWPARDDRSVYDKGGKVFDDEHAGDPPEGGDE